jgi:hypothetical protein
MVDRATMIEILVLRYPRDLLDGATDEQLKERLRDIQPGFSEREMLVLTPEQIEALAELDSERL